MVQNIAGLVGLVVDGRQRDMKEGGSLNYLKSKKEHTECFNPATILLLLLQVKCSAHRSCTRLMGI